MDHLTFLQILVLALVQGAAELLPVSSSAHVIVAEKLMGIDPTAPEMTLLLVMLHTGTMFAVIVFFRKAWQTSFFSSQAVFLDSLKNIAAATLLTGLVGFSLKALIEKFILQDAPNAEIELIFGNLKLISAALGAAGMLILYSGLRNRRHVNGIGNLGLEASCWIGAFQGVCLPFRGFSRSGATISAGLIMGIAKIRAEEFSFALAVVLTPPIIVREVLRLLKARHTTLSATAPNNITHLFLPSLLGMALSFLAGIFALKWLSDWLEHDRWHLFGIYCLAAAAIVLILQWNGL